MLTLEEDGTMADSSILDVHFLNKPLYFWTKSFADSEMKRDESFSKFLSTNALNHALEYIGIGNENEQSSLHLSAIFDEENTGQCSLGSSSSRTSKLISQAESETKARVQALSHIFNELKAYFEDHFSQLVLLRPPNAVHVATSCQHCCVEELEKVLLLLLGASVQGVRKQDTIRKIKGFPKPIQQQLIQAIKNATENPELLHVKPWSEYCTLDSAAQHKIYDNLLSQLRRLLAERNDAIEAQLLSDYSCGFTSCDQKRSYGLARESGNLMDSLEEKYSDENRASAALRQLRHELLEKSDLLQECREELEMTKCRVQELQQELSDTLKDLRSCKKSRDEFDVLREGQEKSLRLEAELRRMKKKLEESEQYYERVEILQNENRNHQRKHAILMDQINMLTVEKERLEVSFLTQQNNRSLSGHFSQDELDDCEWSLNRTENRFEDELILDTTEESAKAKGKAPVWTELLPTPTLTPSPSPKPPMIELVAESEPVVVQEIAELEAAEPLAVIPSTTQILDESSEPVPVVSSPCPLSKDEEKGGLELEPESLLEAEFLDSSSGSTQLAEMTEEEVQEEAIVPEQQDQEHRQGSDKRRWKGGRRRSSGLYVKRTRKSLPGTSKVVLCKATALSSTEKLDQIPQKHQLTENHSLPHNRKNPGRSPRGGHRLGHRRRRSEGKQVVPTVDLATDADAELSMSPTVHRYFSSSSGSDAEILGSSQLSSGRRAFLKRGSPSGRVLSRKLPSNAWITHGNRSPVPPPPEEPYRPLHGSDNELFFVCSTTQPATARNVKISKGRQIPLVQMVNNIAEPRRMHEGLELRGGQSVASESGIRRGDDVAEALSRCNIQVSLRHVNRSTHQLSLGRDETEGLDNTLEGHQPGLSRGAFSRPLNLNLAWGQNGRDAGGSPVNNSSSDDDESVWYEYGCV